MPDRDDNTIYIENQALQERKEKHKVTHKTPTIRDLKLGKFSETYRSKAQPSEKGLQSGSGNVSSAATKQW